MISTMTTLASKEHYLTAFARQEPDRVPVHLGVKFHYCHNDRICTDDWTSSGHEYWVRRALGPCAELRQQEDATRAALDACAPGGGRTLASIAGVWPEIPWENIETVIRTAHEYR